jgi:hypothetical protein
MVSAIVAACDSNDSPPTSSTLIDASTPKDGSPPVTSGDASGDPVDAAADARRSDAAPDATLGVCNSYPALLCNFNGICPALSGIGIGPGGYSGFQPDGGIDGSTSFYGYASDAGGGGFFTMPFREITDPNTPPPSVEHCAVTCEANIRIAAGEALPFAIVIGDDLSFNLEAVDGGFVHTAPSAAPAAHTILASNDWIRVKVHQIPPNTGSGTLWTSTLTITSSDAGTSSTTSVQTAKRGSSVQFGVSSRGSLPTPALVFVDDVTCKLSDL